MNSLTRTAAPPPLGPGHERRILYRRDRETAEAAVHRARKLSWWRRVIREHPHCTGHVWMWTIRVESSSKSSKETK